MAVSVQCSMAILYIFLFILAGVSQRGSVSISCVRLIVQRRSYDYLALIPVKYLTSDQDCTIQKPPSTNYTHTKKHSLSTGSILLISLLIHTSLSNIKQLLCIVFLHSSLSYVSLFQSSTVISACITEL